MPLSLSIVIPAFNEASRLEAGFQRVASIVDALGAADLEVVVVDDGSTDDTGPRAARVYGDLPHASVVRHEHNRGKGAAVRTGFTMARGEHVVVCDADMAIDPRHIPDLIAALATADIAVGSRNLNGTIHYDSRLRTVAGGAFNALVRREVGTDLRDTQCGFKGYRLGVARLLGALSTVDRFAFDVEALMLAHRLDLRVTPVTVTWDDVDGSSINVVRDSVRMIRDILSLRSRPYEVPVITTSADVDAVVVRSSAVASRLGGLCLARGSDDCLIVLPRNGAVGAIDVARAVGGSIGVAGTDRLRGRRLEGV